MDIEMKDIVVFDIETSGLDKTKDHILQFSAMKFNGSKIIDDINIYIRPEGEYSISIQAYLKHKIKPSFLKDKPTLREVADQIINFIGDNTILGYNIIGFDIPFLDYHLRKIGKSIDFTKHTVYDAFYIERNINNLTLENTYKRYKGKAMEECGLTPHDAYSDIKATYSVFFGQAKNHKELVVPTNIVSGDGLVEYADFMGKKNVLCFAYGKYKNLPIYYIKDIDIGYINWILCNPDFSPKIKEIINAI